MLGYKKSMLPKKRNRNEAGLILPVVVAAIGLIALFAVLAFLGRENDFALLNPKGAIAEAQTKLLIQSTLVLLGFAVPVALTIYFFVWRYREDNEKITYTPETKERKAFLVFAWGGPMVVVAILASLMLPATHQLQPQKPIDSTNEELTVQVVALNWKWLFIYPEQDVATLNYVQIPVDTPVRFELTADGAPMSSFWIPHLGGMLYVMTGHVNPLNLISDTVGDYPGGSAEINGRGFAHMQFNTKVSTKEDFDAWATRTKESSTALSLAEYEKLRVPEEDADVAFYSNPTHDLFNTIVSKYGSHDHGNSGHEGHGSY